ncbi:uncharacterized protein BJ171DRAFT_544505 [Polychytrium aggregatum]|uniref:uncharacterized protein n=1 Tax=Polychytrium aggregatum TaxID=110093 RepID=UPI0022FDBED9|nr:uncharacterized protein BJ171DRAFT_544505 [Polychytrium aggregatum]KAI9190568.1 hypothetical protein BJ171DRAFT_544505 [Polychytrium aggregatum]
MLAVIEVVQVQTSRLDLDIEREPQSCYYRSTPPPRLLRLFTHGSICAIRRRCPQIHQPLHRAMGQPTYRTRFRRHHHARAFPVCPDARCPGGRHGPDPVHQEPRYHHVAAKESPAGVVLADDQHHPRLPECQDDRHLHQLCQRPGEDAPGHPLVAVPRQCPPDGRIRPSRCHRCRLWCTKLSATPGNFFSTSWTTPSARERDIGTQASSCVRFG